MKRIRIVHETQYHYNQPVKFGPHRALLRPREGHDVHISQSRLSVTPAAAVRWLRDIYGNSIAVLTFEESSQRLCVASEVDVELYDDNPIECLIEPTARQFPFQYLPEEQVELMVYRLARYPYDGPQLQNWLHDLYRPGQVISTFDLLYKLNAHIHESFKYARRASRRRLLRSPAPGMGQRTPSTGWKRPCRSFHYKSQRWRSPFECPANSLTLFITSR